MSFPRAGDYAAWSRGPVHGKAILDMEMKMIERELTAPPPKRR